MSEAMNRRNFLKLTGAGATALALGATGVIGCQRAAAMAAGPAPAGTAHPNVIFILADDLGWRDTTLYGSSFYETPNIDKLAKRGMMFTNAYAANPLCSPTRASIMTGLWPARIGITMPSCHLEEVVLEKMLSSKANPNQKALPAQPVTRLKLGYHTLAEVLKEAGYATGHFGKWHLGRDPYNPQNQGFDVDIPHWFGPSPLAYLSPWKFSHYDNTPWKVPYDEGKPGEHIEDRMSTEVIKFMRAHQEEPFFVNYWCYSIHGPWEAKPDLIEKYRRKADPTHGQRHPIVGAMIETMDDNIGKVMQAIDELGLADNTIIVFMGDNGGLEKTTDKGEFADLPITDNAPLRGGKATIYEGGTREPCLVIWPGVVKPGSKSDEVISSVDFFPTLIGATGARLPSEQGCDGIDIKPALTGGKLAREAIYCHFPHTTGVPEGRGPATWVRKGDWKLIRFYCDNDDKSDSFELYNLKDDIGETKNLAATMPEKVHELSDMIAQFLKDTAAVIPQPNPVYRIPTAAPEGGRKVINPKTAKK